MKISKRSWHWRFYSWVWDDSPHAPKPTGLCAYVWGLAGGALLLLTVGPLFYGIVLPLCWLAGKLCPPVELTE